MSLPELDEEFPEWTGGTDADFHFQRGWNAHVRALGDDASRRIKQALSGHARRGMGAEDFCTCNKPWPCLDACTCHSGGKWFAGSKSCPLHKDRHQ